MRLAELAFRTGHSQMINAADVADLLPIKALIAQSHFQ